jgi:hypothetical protein
MYNVYWTEEVNRHTEDQVNAWFDMTGELLDINAVEGVAMFELFQSNELNEALKFSEGLRAKRRAGEKITFITMASEDPNCVGEQGVSDKLPEGYDWTKQDRAGSTRRRR